MKILKSVSPKEQITPPANSLPNNTKAVQSSLLQLPLELRRMVYFESILVSRCPTPQQVHERNFRAIWEDLPTPLLSVNKQIRDEVFDILQKSPFTMRVTSYGASFDMLGLSSFISQQRPKSYSGLPKVGIEIWPPHPDRPVEMYNINYYLTELRNELRATSVGISTLVIFFQESKIAKWTQDGQLRFDLGEPGNHNPLFSDIAKVLDHFACVTNVTKVRIDLPHSLQSCEEYDEVRCHAMKVCNTMEGYGTLVREAKYTLSDHDISHLKEQLLKAATAEKARAKLDAITIYGCFKMSEAEWLAFTEVWPHFETLTEWDEGGAFKGERHYWA